MNTVDKMMDLEAQLIEDFGDGIDDVVVNKLLAPAHDKYLVLTPSLAFLVYSYDEKTETWMSQNLIEYLQR